MNTNKITKTQIHRAAVLHFAFSKGWKIHSHDLDFCQSLTDLGEMLGAMWEDDTSPAEIIAQAEAIAKRLDIATL